MGNTLTVWRSQPWQSLQGSPLGSDYRPNTPSKLYDNFDSPQNRPHQQSDLVAVAQSQSGPLAKGRVAFSRRPLPSAALRFEPISARVSALFDSLPGHLHRHSDTNGSNSTTCDAVQISCSLLDGLDAWVARYERSWFWVISDRHQSWLFLYGFQTSEKVH